MEKGGGYHQISRAFNPMVRCGMDFVTLYVDRSEDLLNGEIGFARTPWTTCMPDPNFMQLDGSDMTYFIRREYLTQRQLEMLLPGVDPQKNLQPTEQAMYGPAMDPGLFPVRQQDRYLVTEIYTRTFTPRTYLLSRKTGEMRQVDVARNSMEEERLRIILQQMPELVPVKRQDKDVQYQIFIGEDQIYKGPEPTRCGDIPITPIMCYWDPEYEDMKWKLQGIVRSLRDSAEELNKRRSQILHIINTLAMSGWMWEQGAVTDETQFDDASGAGVMLRLAHGGLQRVEQIVPPKFPTGLINLEKFFEKDATDISGINAELLSMYDKDMPGISIKLRQRQGLVIIQEIFDNLSFGKKAIGKKFMKAVQNNYEPFKIARIIGELPSPQFFTKDFERYDAIVDEADNNPTQRDAIFQKLIWFNQNVMPVHPMVMLQAADIPHQYRDTQAQYMQMMLGMGGQEGPGGPGSTPAGGAGPGPTLGMREGMSNRG